jgi:uncharacterized protein
MGSGGWRLREGHVRGRLHDTDAAAPFNDAGMIDSVRAEARGGMVGKEMVMRPWQCGLSNCEVRSGMNMPISGQAAWLRAAGPRPYFFGSVTSITAILAFVALAFVWSWAFWLLSPLLKAVSEIAAAGLFFVGGFGPSLAAVAVVAHHGGRCGLLRCMKCCLQWRVGWRWIALAFFFPVGFMGLAAVAHVALGGSLPDSPASGHAVLAALNFPLVFFIGGPLGEEFGGRGYAQPAVQARWGWRSASLVLGALWARGGRAVCALAPTAFLLFLYSAGTAQSHLPMGLYALSAVASSVVFAWLYNRSRCSVLPVLVLHTAINAWSPVIPVIPVMMLPEGSNLRAFQFVVGILVLTALALLLRTESAPRRDATLMQP